MITFFSKITDESLFQTIDNYSKILENINFPIIL